MNYLINPDLEQFRLELVNKTNSSIKYLNSFPQNEEVTIIFVNKYMYSKAINNFQNEIYNYKNKNIIIYVIYYDKIEKLALSAAEYFDVLVEKNLTLLTIRYYSKEKFDELTKDKKILLTQQTTETIQALLH